MSLYNPHDRYRRRKANQITSIVISLCVVGFIFGFGYVMGKQFGAQDAIVLRKDVEELRGLTETLEREKIESLAEAKTANIRYEQLQETYADITSNGDLKEMVDMLRSQLESGMDSRRLKFVIRSARPPQNCSDPETKRFVLSTPAYDGAANVITLADGFLKITGAGESAKNKSGKPEAWYDPAKRVSLQFSVPGKEQDVRKGVMPLQHSMVVQNREYRFTIDAGAKSFARITFDSCDYP
jgi:hypothetical protein